MKDCPPNSGAAIRGWIPFADIGPNASFAGSARLSYANSSSLNCHNILGSRNILLSKKCTLIKHVLIYRSLIGRNDGLFQCFACFECKRFGDEGGTDDAFFLPQGAMEKVQTLKHQSARAVLKCGSYKEDVKQIPKELSQYLEDVKRLPLPGN